MADLRRIEWSETRLTNSGGEAKYLLWSTPWSGRYKHGEHLINMKRRKEKKETYGAFLKIGISLRRFSAEALIWPHSLTVCCAHESFRPRHWPQAAFISWVFASLASALSKLTKFSMSASKAASGLDIVCSDATLLAIALILAFAKRVASFMASISDAMGVDSFPSIGFRALRRVQESRIAVIDSWYWPSSYSTALRLEGYFGSLGPICAAWMSKLAYTMRISVLISL